MILTQSTQITGCCAISSKVSQILKEILHCGPIAADPARHGSSAETVRIPAKTGSARADRARMAALQSGAR